MAYNLPLKSLPVDLCSGFLRPEKIRQPQSGLNPRTLDLEASTLPRDHRGRLSTTLSLHSSLNVRDHVSQPYSTTGNTIVLYILMYPYTHLISHLYFFLLFWCHHLLNLHHPHNNNNNNNNNNNRANNLAN